MTLHDPRAVDYGMLLIDEYLAWLRDVRGCTDDTIRSRREVLTRIHAALPYGLDRACADELRAQVFRPELRASSKSTYYGTLAAFYSWAFDPRDPWLAGDNPMIWMPPRPKMPRGIARPVTDQQLARILTEAAQPYRLWALIAAYQGLRCIEISRLDREHIAEDKLLVLRGKGGGARVHDTDPDVWAAVKDLPPGPVAVDPKTGQRATAHHISVKSAQHFRNKLGMPGVSMHRLRHWLGVTTCDATDNVRVVQEMLGHDALSSTQIYTRATVGQQRAARARLPRLAG